MSAANAFTREAYQGQEDGSLRSAAEVLPIVLQFVKPQSVVDVGCGVGTWLSVIQKAGISEFVGIDGEYVDPQWLRIPHECFVARNLAEPFDLDRKFEMAISLEVAEHLPPSAADGFVRSLTHLAPVILFSAAVPGQCGRDHLNEQWPEYWAALFRKDGFVAVDCLRPRLWNNPRIEWWYRENMVLYIRQDRVADFPELASHLVDAPLALVHPELYHQHRWAADYSNWSLRQAWGVFKAVARDCVLRKTAIGVVTQAKH